MNLHKYTAIKMARALAEQARLNVILEEEAHPRTDGSTLFLQNPKDGWSEDRWAIWWGHLYHEIGHNDPAMRDCFTIAKEKKIDMSSFIGMGLNLIDDNRQERYKWNEYQGRRTYLSRAHVLTMLDLLGKKKVFGQTDDDHRNAMEAALCWDTYDREGWMEGMFGLGDKVYAQLKPQAQAWTDDLLRSRFNMADNKTAADEYQQWKDIIDEIFKFNSDEEEKKAQESYVSSEDGSGKDSEADDKSGKSKSKGDAKGKGKSAESKELQRVKYSDLLKHDHSDTKDGGHAPIHIEYDTSDDGQSFISTPVETIDYTKGESRNRGSGREYLRSISNTVSHAGSLSATVRRLLQIRSRDRYEYGKKRGKLHGSSLHRLSIKDGGGLSERVFKQKKINNCLDVSFTVLGDASGSMSGSKYINMAASMVMLHEAIAPLGIPFELLAFTDRTTSEISIFKTFTSKTNPNKLMEDLADCGASLHNNADGEAILYAYSRLAAQKTKRKVLVVLSDGSPASHRGGTDSHTRMVVEEIEKRGEVEIYGVGIEDENVSRIYKSWQVINDSSELESALLNLISTKILN